MRWLNGGPPDRWTPSRPGLSYDPVVPASPRLVLPYLEGGRETGQVNTVVALIVAFLLPTAAGFALMGGVRALRWAGEHRGYTPPAAEPIERLSANLRRLRAELEATETRLDVPAKALRLRALRGAYLDTLAVACQRLEVSPPPRGDQDSRPRDLPRRSGAAPARTGRQGNRRASCPADRTGRYFGLARIRRRGGPDRKLGDQAGALGPAALHGQCSADSFNAVFEADQAGSARRIRSADAIVADRKPHNSVGRVDGDAAQPRRGRAWPRWSAPPRRRSMP